jgi:hypothetical protein
MRTRIFFPQPLLDVLMDAGKIDVQGEEIVLAGSGRRYRVVEGARVLSELTDGVDPHDLCGRVKSRLFLQELGAELLGDSMIVADKAYQILMGFVGVPMGHGDEAGEAGKSEEDVLRELQGAVG